ncbi:hypothetical protein [Acrocarpospora macrocephala]|uniref:hypothetical protein n=1 Tax=Acrocarpospora macrocephala TaxID=150177 RepID=UPI0012D30D63|nr:hypothetical protein [Acrocarpospora macrocephala]
MNRLLRLEQCRDGRHLAEDPRPRVTADAGPAPEHDHGEGPGGESGDPLADPPAAVVAEMSEAEYAACLVGLRRECSQHSRSFLTKALA